jgi:hypothetical protein
MLLSQMKIELSLEPLEIFLCGCDARNARFHLFPAGRTTGAIGRLLPLPQIKAFRRRLKPKESYGVVPESLHRGIFFYGC